jgi:hypothetical protein
MVAAFAAQAPGQHEPFRAALKGGGHGDFAVGLVLGGGIGLADHVRPFGDQGIGRGIEIANPEFRRQAERACMTHAAIGRNDAGAGKLGQKPVRRRQRAAHQDYESLFAHGARP